MTKTGLNRSERPTVGDEVASADHRGRYLDADGCRHRNEQRKLDHRLQIAEKLRENAMRNGNPNLLETADRMERRAYEHYESRLDRIGRNLTEEDGAIDGLSDIPGGMVGVTEPLDSVDVGEIISGEVQSFARYHAIEERKLQHQLDVAQHLRDIAARNGNENLVRTAERMEQMATLRYQRTLENLDPLDLDSSHSAQP